MYNKKLDNLIKKDNFYAHIKSGSKEPLLEHLKLTLKYYRKICEIKNLDNIVRKIISKIYNGISIEVQDKIFELFEAAIYYHDIGKINPNFQTEKMKNKMKTNIIGTNHSILSAKLYIAAFEEDIKQNEKFNNKEKTIIIGVIYYFAFAISRHHSPIKYIENFIDELQNQDVPEICGEIQCGYIKIFEEREKIFEKEVVDKIAIYILEKVLYSPIITADYYATYEYMSGKEYNLKQKNINLFDKYKESDLFKKINSGVNKDNDSINTYRSQIFLESENVLKVNLNKNIFFLEAPTGSGKTNTSINLARVIYENLKEINSVNYIFPFNTLIEQTQEVFDSYFENSKDFIVINSVAPIIQKEDEDTEIVYMNNLFRNYPITITSHVNLFNSLFGIGKEENFSLIDYANSVVILDEIQAYKNNIWREIFMMIEKYAELLNIKFIIMSATLPSLNYLTDNTSICNLLKNSSKYYNLAVFKNRVMIDYSLLGKQLQLEDLKKEVLKYKGKKVLVEFIKKSVAREFYNLIKGETVAFEITGDDNNFERKNILKEIKERKEVVVVSTQTIEAGIDIDMDVGYKDISFIDSEEQFLGRINRSAKKDNCKAYFFNYTNADEIYRGDLRARMDVTDEELGKALKEKNFAFYFSKLLKRIRKQTEKLNKYNIERFLIDCEMLKFEDIDKRLKLIDSNTQQIFLNYEYKIENKIIRGKDIWNEYIELIKNREMNYAEKKIKLSLIQDKVNLFTYNIYINKFNTKFFDNECAGILYIENGQEFITEDNKFDREKYQTYTGGLFL